MISAKAQEKYSVKGKRQPNKSYLSIYNVISKDELTLQQRIDSSDGSRHGEPIEI